MQNLRISAPPAQLAIRPARTQLNIDAKEPIQSSRLQVTPHSFNIKTGQPKISINYRAINNDLGFRSPNALKQHLLNKSKSKATEAIAAIVSDGDAYLNNPDPSISIQLSKSKGNYNANVEIAAKPTVGPDISVQAAPSLKVDFQKGNQKMESHPYSKVSFDYQRPDINITPSRVDVRV